MYVAYTGPDPGDPGGVAVFEVTATSCRDAWEELTDCPSCEHPDCVVVGTIHGYRPGFALLDGADEDSPTDPATDAAAKIARIDNAAGRTRLRSTAALERAIECLLDAGVGKNGKDGKDGKDGTTGPTAPTAPTAPTGLPAWTARTGRAWSRT